MRVNDNGFTERVATPAAPVTGAASTGQQGRSTTTGVTSETGDNLQLSGFAARLNSGSSADASNRAERVSQLAKAINDKTFQISSSVVSAALVSEAVRGTKP